MKKILTSTLFGVLLAITATAQYVISGNVYNDPDAGNVNTSATGFTLPNDPLIVLLIESGGDTVSNSSSVNSVTGAFSMSGVQPGVYYTMLISPFEPAPIGSLAPPMRISSNWTWTGESLLADGTPDALADGKTGLITVTSSSITGIKFGIQERPFADNKMNNLLDHTAAGPVPLSVNTGVVFTQGDR